MDFYDSNMVNRFEQVNLFSPGEYRRRYDGVRKIMKDRDIQVCIFLECAEEAYDHWLLGRRFLDYVIVPAEGEVLGVLFGEPGLFGRAAADYSRSLMQKPVDSVCDGTRIIGRVSDEQIAGLLAASKPGRIGLVLPSHLNAGLAEAIGAKLPKAELVDITMPIAIFKAIKSPEEMAAVYAARDVQAAVFNAMPQMLRAGRTMGEINAEMKRLLMELGCSGVVHSGIQCKGRQNEPSYMNRLGNDHKAEYGERFYCMMEANGPGHQHVAFGRFIVLGEPDKAYADFVSLGVKLHNYAVSLMTPAEITLAQIAVKTRKYANRLGYELVERVGWNWMHSMGAYYYEQFSLEDYTEYEPLAENIILHCHPLTYRYFPELGPNVRDDVCMLNTYFVTKDGAQDLSGIPLDLIVIE